MLRNEICEFFYQEDGVGVIEIVLILVGMIGLVIIFKSQITELLNNIFNEIDKQSKEVY
jgi:ABC-type arginine transport system permease subunit